MTDERQFSIVPIRALLDERLDMADRAVLLALGAHTNRLGLCHPGQATLMRYSRLKERALRNALRHLEECGYLKTWKEGAENRYQVLNDATWREIMLEIGADEDRHPDAGVINERRHRHPDAGPLRLEDDRHPDAGPAPGYRSNRHEGADETGTAVPGERVVERRTELTAVGDAREEDAMGEVTTGDTKRDTVASVNQLAIDLGVAVNHALRDNPAMRKYAEMHPLRADLAITPLTDWLAEGIPFELIRETCVKVAARFSPAQKGDHIARFTYFDRIIRAEWGKVQANAAVDAAAPPTPTKKLRRLTA